MKKELIKELFEKACYSIEGVECWSARVLMVTLGSGSQREMMMLRLPDMPVTR